MAEHKDPYAHDGHGDPDPEVAAGPVAKVLVAVAVTMLVAAALMWPMVSGLVGWSTKHSSQGRVIDVARPAGPLLQEDPEADLDHYQARQAVAESSYGWVDENGGIARIPLARATELVLEEGLELGSGSAVSEDAAPAAAAGAEDGGEEEPQ